MPSKPARGGFGARCSAFWWMTHNANVFHFFVLSQVLVWSFSSFSPSQGSSCAPPHAAPAGSHLAQQSGWSTSFTAGHVPTRGPHSESPGGRLAPSGARGSFSVRSGSFGGEPAGHAGTSDASPDQGARVCGSQGHLTGNQLKSRVCLHLRLFPCTIKRLLILCTDRRWSLCLWGPSLLVVQSKCRPPSPWLL